MRTVLLISISFLFGNFLSAQTSDLHIFPDPSLHDQCPDEIVVYRISPWTSICPVSVNIVGGELGKHYVSSETLYLFITWHKPVASTEGRIELLWGDSLCGGSTFHKSWDISIIPSYDIKPTIEGPDYYYIGSTNFVTLTPAIAINGTFPAPDFLWQIPSGTGYDTSLTFNSGKEDFIIPVFDTLHEYCIKVQGSYPCTSNPWSDWTEHCIKGTFFPPSIPQLSSQNFICGDTTEITLSTLFNVELPQIPQYTWSPPVYHWTFPPNWIITSNSPNTANTISVKPDGHTDGIISLYFTINGITSEVSNYTITFLPANPATTVLGPDYVCQNASFSLNISPPAEAEVTWQISPVDATTTPVISPDHGSGTAQFQVTDLSVSGYFRITYTISTSCGNTTRSKDFFVGQPVFTNTTLDGALYNA